MAHTYWPLFDLRVRTPAVSLRPATEADLPVLAGLLPDDVEQDPALPAYGGADGGLTRAARLCQSYWRCLGTWRPSSWNLEFVVEWQGQIVGVQSLEAEEFGARRTVESASWLATRARGRGVGKQMRLAVLWLAFEGLGAQVAETEAWHHNAASLGVSRSLGYTPNGVYRHARGDGSDDMVRMRLTRERWRELHAAAEVQISDLKPCVPFFGA